MNRENNNKCLYCGCDIKRDNQGITRQNLINYRGYDTQETICLKCYNKGIDFGNFNTINKEVFEK